MEFNEAGAWSFETVEMVLRRRGHVIAGTGEIRDALFPGERIGPILQAYIEQHPGESLTAVFGTEAVKRSMELYGRTGVRRMLRKLVLDPSHAKHVKVLAGIAG